MHTRAHMGTSADATHQDCLGRSCRRARAHAKHDSTEPGSGCSCCKGSASCCWAWGAEVRSSSARPAVGSGGGSSGWLLSLAEGVELVWVGKPGCSTPPSLTPGPPPCGKAGTPLLVPECCWAGDGRPKPLVPAPEWPSTAALRLLTASAAAAAAVCCGGAWACSRPATSAIHACMKVLPGACVRGASTDPE